MKITLNLQVQNWIIDFIRKKITNSDFHLVEANLHKPQCNMMLCNNLKFVLVRLYRKAEGFCEAHSLILII